jgi:alpha-beta hydrolase superfamily lysophospholipase
VSIKEISFPSANGRDTVKAWAYSPLGTPRAIVQIIHGFGEHSRRYLHMISKFQAAGFVVLADDHIGHGKTGFDSQTLGDPHSKNFMDYINDERTLHDIAVTDYPGIPYCVFGHSWGSMIARAYAAHYGDDVRALMLCGVVSQMKGCEIELNDDAFKAAYEADPYRPAGRWFEKTFIGMTDRLEGTVGVADWIANDPRIVNDHALDPFNTFNVTLQLVWDLVQLYGFIENEAWAKMVPSDIPVYLIAGDHDPCCNYGEGLYHVANLLANSGNKVRVKAYPGYRHEIHNELDLRDEVEQGLIDFINEAIK